jgi:hypothetical protein
MSKTIYFHAHKILPFLLLLCSCLSLAPSPSPSSLFEKYCSESNSDPIPPSFKFIFQWIQTLVQRIGTSEKLEEFLMMKVRGDVYLIRVAIVVGAFAVIFAFVYIFFGGLLRGRGKI